MSTVIIEDQEVEVTEETAGLIDRMRDCIDGMWANRDQQATYRDHFLESDIPRFPRTTNPATLLREIMRIPEDQTIIRIQRIHELSGIGMVAARKLYQALQDGVRGIPSPRLREHELEDQLEEAKSELIDTQDSRDVEAHMYKRLLGEQRELNHTIAEHIDQWVNSHLEGVVPDLAVLESLLDLLRTKQEF
jgi:hypothetical protein